jgi:hypothetical protein
MTGVVGYKTAESPGARWTVRLGNAAAITLARRSPASKEDYVERARSDSAQGRLRWIRPERCRACIVPILVEELRTRRISAGVPRFFAA